jgi:hypothetical protein
MSSAFKIVLRAIFVVVEVNEVFTADLTGPIKLNTSVADEQSEQQIDSTHLIYCSSHCQLLWGQLTNHLQVNISA